MSFLSQVDFQAVRREVNETRALCDAIGSPIVFNHNDLLPGNILILQQQEQPASSSSSGSAHHTSTADAATAAQPAAPQAAGHPPGATPPGPLPEEASASVAAAMQIIDYEYSAYGPRGFDFGNHFNEYAGFDCDYSRYPQPHQQRLFFTHYLQVRFLLRCCCCCSAPSAPLRSVALPACRCLAEPSSTGATLPAMLCMHAGAASRRPGIAAAAPCGAK